MNLTTITRPLVVVGALNWGLVSVARFDLVATLTGETFGSTNAATRLVYGAVGLAPAWPEGISYLRDGEGHFLEVGLASDTGDVSFNPSTQLVQKNATFIGSLGIGSDQDSVAAARIMEGQLLPLERVVSHQLPLERVGDAMDALNGDYRVDGRAALKIAIAPNGPVE